MSIIVIKSNEAKVGFVFDRRQEFLLDSADDLYNLPLDCMPGSKAYLVDNSRCWMMGSEFEWIECAMTTGGSGSIPTDVLRHTYQVLNSDQKSQARENIGAADANEVKQLSEEIDELKGSGGGAGEPGKPGKDGGYYTPTVATDGTLTWTASKSDMPSVASASIKGPKGDAGEQGPAGADGAKGEPGERGEPGKDGYTPIKGVDYFDGEPGAKGDKGDTGATGPEGPQGPKGDKGDTGAAGSNGAAGKDGKTAYQYAQDGGYAGTEAEFAAKLASETGNPLRGKKVSFLGDSICAGGSESTSYLGGYGKIIADRNSMIYENVARGGATVTAETYSRSTGNAKPWLCRMVENMSADADYAIIEGGINDGWDETVREKIGAITRGYDATLDDTTYYGAFESMLKQLVTKFQGKKIGYIAVPKIHSLFDSSQNAPNFYHIALECCAKWGVSVCDLNTITPPVEYLSDLGTAYTADACHPTYEGYLKYYCDPIEAWMRTLTTGASVGQASSVASGDYVRKSDVQIKKAQLTLDDGSTVLIDVVVASAGATLNKYINLVPEAVDTTGNVYNGTGYKKDYRLSSSGAEKSQAGAVVTGYIPAAGGDVVRLAGVLPWYQSSYNNNYLCAYDTDFNFVGAVYNTVKGYSYTKDIAASYELGDVCEITLASGMNIAYIRASWPGFTAEQVSSTADLIVTINQEIT